MEYSTFISKGRYECVVCRLHSLTLADLHRHQTYRHTSEELSLSSIVLRSTLINGINTSDASSFMSSLLRNPPSLSELYTCSAALLNDGKTNVHHIAPINYALKNKKESISNEPFPLRFEHQQTDRELKSQKLLYRRARFMSKGVLDLSCKISPLQNKRKVHRTSLKQSKRKVPRKPRNVERIQQDPKKNVVPIEICPAVEDLLEGTYLKSSKINRQRKKTASARSRNSVTKIKLAAGHSTKANTKREKTLPMPLNDEDDQCELNLEGFKIRPHTMKENLRACSAKQPSIKRRKAPCIEPNEQDEPEEIQLKTTEIDWQTKRSAPQKTKVTKKERALTRKVAKSRTKRGKAPIITWRDTSDRKEVIGGNGINNLQNKEEAPAQPCPASKRKTILSTSVKSVKIPDTIQSAAFNKDDREEIHLEGSKFNEPGNVDEKLVLCKVESSELTADTFQSRKTFPFYPPNIDERSILVLDPVLDELVWTTLVLSDDTSSDNNNNGDGGKYTTEIMIEEDNLQKIQNHNECDCESSLPVKMSQQNLLYSREDTTNFVRDKSTHVCTSEICDTSSDGEYVWHHRENVPNAIDNGLLRDEKKLPIRYDVRPQRIRSTPHRFVPY